MDKAIKYFPPVLVIFHLVGISMFLIERKAPDLTFANLLLSACLVLLAEENLKKAILIFTLIFLGGFLIELIGVQTGLLFGNYWYEDAMGPLLFKTPIIIGATWYAVVVGAANISRYVKGSILSRAILTGLLTVLMDILIEKVAINYGLWNWQDGEIPYFNYFCWFIFSALFALVYLRFTDTINKTAVYLYFIWIGFFSLLTFI
jgi:putative membrane protein